MVTGHGSSLRARHPLAGPPLSAGNLVRRHLSCERVANRSGFFRIASHCFRSRQFEPHIRFVIVPRNALTVLVTNSEIVLRVCVVLIRSFAVPVCRLNIILFNAVTMAVELTEVVLRFNIAQIGSLPIPANCFGVILRESKAVVVHHA